MSKLPPKDQPPVATDARESFLDNFLRIFLALLMAMVVLVMYPYSRDPAVDTKILVYAWGAAFLTPVFLVGWFLKKRPLTVPPLLSGPMAVLFGWFVLAGILSKYPGNSLAEITKFVPLLLLYFLASQVYREPRHIHGLMAAVCAAVGISILYGVFQHFGLDPFPWDPSLLAALVEAPGTFGNGNLAAHATVLCMVMAAYVVAARLRYWYLYAGLGVLLLIHLDLSSQRGGLLGLAGAAALVMMTVLIWRKTGRPGRSIVAGFVCATILGVIGIGGLMAWKYVRTGIPLPTSLPLMLRYNGYGGAAKLMVQKPLIGYGPGNYRTENPRMWTPFEQEHFASQHRMNYHAHNDVLEVGVEAGLPAGAMYAALLIMAAAGALWLGLVSGDPGRRRMGLMFAGFFFTFFIDGLFGFNLRAVVSSAMLFVFAGAFEGLWHAEYPPAPRPAKGPAFAPVATAAVLCLLAFGAVAVQTMSFIAGTWYLRGRGAMYYQAWPQAEESFAKGQALAPWDWEFEFQRGETARMEYAAANALKHFDAAARLNPYFPPIYVRLAQCDVMLAELAMADKPVKDRLDVLDAAEKYAARAIELCAPLPEAEDGLGRAWSLRASVLQGAPGTNPDDVKKTWEQAEAHFQRAIDLNSSEKDRVYLMLARTRLAIGKKAEAQEALLHSIEKNPSNPAAWAIFLSLAQTDDVRKVFKIAALKAVASLEKEKKEVPPGLKAVSLIWTANDGGVSAAACLAEAARARSATKARTQKDDLSWAAGAVLDEVTRTGKTPDQIAIPLCNLGSVYAAMSDFARAEKLFEASVNALSGDDFATGATMWGQVLLQSNQAPKAVEMLRKAVTRVKDVNLQLCLARALVKAGRNTEARAEFAAVLQGFQLDDKARQIIQREMDATPAQ